MGFPLIKPYPYSWSVMWSNDPDVTGGVASETPRGLYATHRSNKRDRLWRHRAFRERGAMWDWHLESKWPNPEVTGGNWRSQMGPCEKNRVIHPSRVGGSKLILWGQVTCSFSRQVDGWILRWTMISMIGCAVLMGDEEHSWSGFRMTHFSIFFLFVTSKSYIDSYRFI